MTFEAGSWVWLPDDEDLFVPAKVVDSFLAGEAGKVLLENGEEVEVPADRSAGASTADEEVLSTAVDNLINLNDLNENAILHQLRTRFKADKIYTYVSSILISVNPFKLLPLYTPEILESYREGSRGKAPHVFAIGYNAYSAMLNDGADQSVVISGESGAGKSEATKLILQFLADVSSRACGRDAPTGEGNSLEDQILLANPIMEAFGNAKTVRNNNSSRFGKLITVRFDTAGAIVGGNIINYLLEKSRIVSQSEGERNYHIFYQLLAGGQADASLRDDLGLDYPESFFYTNQSKVHTIDGVSDEKEFDEVRNAMDVLKFDEDLKRDIFKVVASVLHLGNIRFASEARANEEDAAVIANEDVLERTAALLGLDLQSLTRSLLTKNIGTHSIIMVSFSVEQAQDARNSLAKAIYATLFDWLIRRINESFGSAEGSSIIGVLDIFGFESFEKNSFEQLCINYCNEKLQFHFNEHIFRLEQEVYASEGVSVPETAFVDNQPTLTLLEEGRGTGIFSMIDEEINVPRGSDESFLRKVLDKHGKHANLIRPKPKSCKDYMSCFGVLHYAGPVFYDCTNFLDKNKDTLPADLLSALRHSESPFVQALFPMPAQTEDTRKLRRTRGSRSNKKTLGTQFKEQLASLMDTLNATSPHFIRCMKPNSAKVGGAFYAQEMLNQLRYTGLLEVCRIRKLGFPARFTFEQFYKRFKCIEPAAAGIDALLAAMQERGTLADGAFAKGSTKVFFKTYAAAAVEGEREQAIERVVLSVQKRVRGWLYRVRYRYFKKIVAGLKESIASRDFEMLQRYTDEAHELPHHGTQLPVYKEARQILQRLQAEGRILGLLEQAMADDELQALVNAVDACDSMSPPFTPDILDAARAEIERLRSIIELKERLREAIAARSQDQLKDLLHQAEEMHVDSEETHQASALLARIREEEAVVDSLRQAIAGRDLAGLNAFLDKMSEMGLDAPEVAEAKNLRDRIMLEATTKKALQVAIDKRDLAQLSSALEKAKALDLGGDPLYSAGAEVKAAVEHENGVKEQLKTAVAARDMAALSEAVAAGVGCGLTDETCVVMKEASELKAVLEAEAACLAALASAAASTDAAKLTAALSDASRLGLSGPEVDAARQVSAKLGAQSEVRTKLAGLADCFDLSALSAALEEAEDAGVQTCPEFQIVSESKARIEAEMAAIEELRAATKAANAPEISRLLSLCKEMGGRFGEEIAAARRRLEELGQQDHALESLQAAMPLRDRSQLDNALKAAEAAGVPAVSLEAARALLEELTLLNDLAEAVGDKDLERARALFATAKGMGVDDGHLQRAQVLLNRESLVAKTREKLSAACAAGNLITLNEALGMAIELGLEGDEIAAAQATRDGLTKVEGFIESVVGASKALEVKAAAPTGIVASDIAPLRAAIAAAQGAGVAAARAELAAAVAFEERMEGMVAVQADIDAVLGSGNAAALKSKLARAEELDVAHLNSIEQLKDEIRELEERASFVADGYGVDIDVEEAEAEAQRKHELARNPRYQLKNFSRLRSPDDFAKGILLHKSKAKEGMLLFQSGVIHKSLMALERDLAKSALHVHKSLLGYMGEKQMSFPATLAQDVLQKGLDEPALRDEIYAQIMKQLSNNPNSTSIAKGWQMLCMAVGTFPPSSEFELYLLNFLQERGEQQGAAVRQYASFSLRTLDGMLVTGPSGFVPAVEEIQAYKERPPILATIELVDGTKLTEELPVTPDLNVEKVLDICTQYLETTDPRVETFGIFVAETAGSGTGAGAGNEAVAGPGGLGRFPRALRSGDYMGDVLVQKARQRRDFKFILKQKLFFHTEELAAPSDDDIYTRLIFMQAEQDFLREGTLVIREEATLVELVALCMAVELGEAFPTDAAGLVAAGIREYLPDPWARAKSEAEWADLVFARCAGMMDLDLYTLQTMCNSIALAHPLWCSHLFPVRMVPNDHPGLAGIAEEVYFCFNATGFHILDFRTQEDLFTVGYPDIYKWGGSSQTFSLMIFADPNNTFEVSGVTSQAAEANTIILDTVKFLVDKTAD